MYRQGTVDVHALRGVSVSIDPGEFTALAGPSGSGKTTLLNMIGCLDHPTSGSVKVQGQDITTLRKGAAAEFRLQNVGFVFQAYNLVPVLTAYENAEFTLMLQGKSLAERRAIVEPLMERVGLKDEMHRRPHELSGGQQQRVAVVRAIAPKPAIVLADEPTANLDRETAIDLLDLMLQLNSEHGITFVFSTHDQNVIDRARRVIRLDSGSVFTDSVESGAA
ncbi:MAG: putative ABC transport system ATP-binding protein [Bradymonadia bacterium]